MRGLPAGSVATAAGRNEHRRLETVFHVALFTTAVVKIALAATLAPFVDEAFYWQESRHLAWSYTDLPPLTAWLIAAGEGLFGHGVLAMRAPFLLIGLALPWLVAGYARRLSGDAGIGWQAGLWTLAMPLAGTLGVLALPDVPLTALALLALDRFDRAAREDRRRDWLWLGVLLALAWLAHLRAGMLWLAGLVFLVACADGRRLWRRPGLWAALGLGLAGLLPVLVFDPAVGAGVLQFQAVDRHPWRFHADALAQPLEQALLVTPLLYGLLLAVLAGGLRQPGRNRPGAALAFAASVLGGYFLLGLFADSERFRVHWPLPGYLPLLALLPLATQRWRARSRRLATPVLALAAAGAALGSLAAYTYLALAAHPAGAAVLREHKAFPEHFIGWNEAGASLRRLLAEPGGAAPLLVADNFMLAAELDFQLAGARPVYVLDHPLNAKHGRARQLAIWQRDEAALHALGPRTVLLAVEETAGREREQVHWLAGLCRRVDGLVPVARVDLHQGRKRIAFYRGRLAEAAVTGACPYPTPA
ncbi:ArnT family glycosyltransferase [Dokdonella koreensis]|uniref:ArnT family glycosyltransferase n=1 Tax=Dokdonella koreensis TaxID=323415 RepID=UPI000ADAA2C0|nr:glycosyltransferase family 39 protein [Dokdonella koreensis]